MSSPGPDLSTLSKERRAEIERALDALRRAAAMARQIASQTDTAIVLVKGGKTVWVTAAELRSSVAKSASAGGGAAGGGVVAGGVAGDAPVAVGAGALAAGGVAAAGAMARVAPSCHTAKMTPATTTAVAPPSTQGSQAGVRRRPNTSLAALRTTEAVMM